MVVVVVVVVFDAVLSHSCVMSCHIVWRDELASPEKQTRTSPRRLTTVGHRGLPKKSTALLKQHLTSERQNCKKQRARRNTVQIPSETTARKATENSTVHTSPFRRGSQDPTQLREKDRDDLRIRVPLHVEKRTIQPTHPKLSQNMYPLSNQALRRRAPCSRPATASHKYIDNCQCTAPHEQRSCRCTTTGPTKNLSKNWNCSNTTASMN